VQLFAGNIVTKRFAICQLTTTKLDIFYFLLYSKLKRLEISSLMATITKRLFKAEATTTPSIDLIKNNRTSISTFYLTLQGEEFLENNI
jgi:hypothetical protein